MSSLVDTFTRVRIAKVVKFVRGRKTKHILLLKGHCCKVLQDPLNTIFVIWVPCKQIVLVSQCLKLTNVVAHCCLVLIKLFQHHQNQTSAEKLSTCDHHP